VGSAGHHLIVLTLDDLVANDSVDQTGADLLRQIGETGSSYLVYSRPRNAGKSTVTEAILAAAPATMPRNEFLGTAEEVAALTSRVADGWLVVAEMGHRGRPGYLAEDEIVRAFDVVAHGYPLASSLHADTVKQLYDVLGRNGIDRARVVGAVRYLVKVQPLGDPFDPATRRVVEHVHEHADGDGQAPVLRWSR
jgi:hypothetical protein